MNCCRPDAIGPSKYPEDARAIVEPHDVAADAERADVAVGDAAAGEVEQLERRRAAFGSEKLTLIASTAGLGRRPSRARVAADGTSIQVSAVSARRRLPAR